MHPLLSALTTGLTFSGDLREDAPTFLNYHACPNTAVHTQSVVETAIQLALRFSQDPARAETAAWLHDISAVFPDDQRLFVSRELNLPILPEEARVPLLLHQKISAEIAQQLFGITDPEVLSAIACHTTLKKEPTMLEMLVFTADKLAWDQKGTPPYFQTMHAALDKSLKDAIWVYQKYLWHSGKLKVIHPWMQDSYLTLKNKFSR